MGLGKDHRKKLTPRLCSQRHPSACLPVGLTEEILGPDQAWGPADRL